MKAYYARSMAIYNTTQEWRDMQLIAKLGYAVIPFPPQSDINAHKAAGQDVMETLFWPLVREANVLFFRALPDGRIPAGVAKEIQYARDAEIPVLELPSSVLRRTISIDETREYLREIGQR